MEFVNKANQGKTTTPRKQINSTNVKSEKLKSERRMQSTHQDYEIREGSKLGKMKVRRKEETPQKERQDLQAIWNNRLDLSPCRYYHTTPKEYHNATKNRAARMAFTTQQHFVWDEESQRPKPRDASRKEGKRHIINIDTPTTSLHQLNGSSNQKAEQQSDRRISSSYKMNSSSNVMNLLQDQVHAPSSIKVYTNSTGKRHSGMVNRVIQKKSDQRETKLIHAEKNRIQRVKSAKGQMYHSDASKYFGFESKVLVSKKITYTTARKRGELQNRPSAPLY